MGEILQGSIPFDLSDDRGLPGIRPLDDGHWLMVDDAYAGQMARRADLLDACRDDVLCLDDGARAAVQELLQDALDLFAQRLDLGFTVLPGHVCRPDGATVALDRSDPLATLGRLLQEDLCILQKVGDEHLLTGAVLCFPAGWRLREKFMRPMTGIHVPVPEYDGNIARRVQRLLDGVQVGRPLWRFNRLRYRDAELHQPRSESDPPRPTPPVEGYFVRSEKQCLFRLPATRAVIFTIHTFVVAGRDAPDWT